MYKNLILIVFIIPFFFGCGYESLYSKNKNFSFYISSLELSGNKEINNLIEKELAKYNKKNEKEFSIKINSNFSKNSIIKDKKGNTTNYELVAEINLSIETNKKNQNISFVESLKIEKNNDNFEQVKYENKIKKNLSKIIANKIIFYLKNSQ